MTSWVNMKIVIQPLSLNPICILPFLPQIAFIKQENKRYKNIENGKSNLITIKFVYLPVPCVSIPERISSIVVTSNPFSLTYKHNTETNIKSLPLFIDKLIASKGTCLIEYKVLQSLICS